MDSTFQVMSHNSNCSLGVRLRLAHILEETYADASRPLFKGMSQNAIARRHARTAPRNEDNLPLCQPTMPESRVRGVVGVCVFSDVQVLGNQLLLHKRLRWQVCASRTEVSRYFVGGLKIPLPPLFCRGVVARWSVLPLGPVGPARCKASSLSGHSPSRADLTFPLDSICSICVSQILRYGFNI